MSDEKLEVPGTGDRTVAFVGGPNAGQARKIPNSAGDVVRGEGQHIYRIYPYTMKGGNAAQGTIFFAFEDGRHPLEMLRTMWEEYSVSAQIRGGDYTHIQRKGDIDSRT